MGWGALSHWGKTVKELEGLSGQRDGRGGIGLKGQLGEGVQGSWERGDWQREEGVGLGSPVRGGALVGYPREAQGGQQFPRGLGAASAPANPPSCLSAPRNRPEGKVLETVGVFEAPKQHGKYETGQVGGSGGAQLTLQARATGIGQSRDFP